MYLKLVRDTDNYYEYGNFWRNKTRSTIEMFILETFLLCDVVESYKLCLEIAYNPELHAETGDTTFVVKENGYIYLSDAIFEPEEGQEELYFKMPIKEYVNVITTWGTKIFTPDPKKRPSEVLIRYENEQFFFDIKQ